MNTYPFNPRLTQRIKTDSPGVSNRQAFVSHYRVAEGDAPVGSATACHAAVALTDAAQVVMTGLTQPAAPRTVSFTTNADGMTGEVTVTGTNFAGVVFSQTGSFNGITTVTFGTAFKTVTSVTLPAKTNASGDAISVGFGNKFGLPDRLEFPSVLMIVLDTVPEDLTMANISGDPVDIEFNTFQMGNAPDGSQIDVYYLLP